MAERCCATCGEFKDSSAFYDRVNKRGKPASPHCRDCARQRLREAYRPFKERLDALKVATGCMDCGYTAHPEALEYDHRPGVVKVGKISKLMLGSSWEAIEAEIAKCDLVCANCHRVRTTTRQDTRRSGGWDRRLRGLDAVTALPVSVAQMALDDDLVNESVPVVLVAPTGT